MEVNCEFSMYPNVNGVSCNIEGLSISSPGTKVLGVKRKHENGMTNNDVTIVWIHKSSLKHFPQGLGQLFPNILVLQIQNCGLKTISRDDLVGLENLESLDLSCNELKSLPDNLFCDMKNLETLWFRNNKLESMSSKLLEPIKNQLKYANFSSNTKIDECYSYCFPEKSLEQLMAVMDETCDEPIEQELVKMSHNAEITAGIEGLWDSHRFADFTIVSGAKQFPIHENILAIQSSVFAAIFENDMKKLEGKMEIQDFSTAAVEDFLRFFYTGDIQDRNSMEVFALAAKYNVPSLKNATEKLILRNVDKENAIEVLNLASLYGSEKLKQKAFDEVQKMFSEIDLTDELKDKPEDVKAIVESRNDCERKIQEAKELSERKTKQLERKKKQCQESAKRKNQAAKHEFEMILEKFTKKDLKEEVEN